MKKWAVAYINFFDNELSIEIIDASTWKKALGKAHPGLEEFLSDDIEEAKYDAFNGDWMFEVKEIKG